MRLPTGWRLRRGAYYWRHYVDGRQVETYLAVKLADAHRAYADLIGKQEHHVRTVDQLLLRYLAVEAPRKAKATQDMIARAVTKLVPVFGRMAIADLTPADLYRYHESRSKKTAAKHEVGVLKAAYSAAVKWGVLKSNHLLGQTRIERARPRDRYVTDEELKAFLARTTKWMRAYVELKLLLGLGQEDMLSLTRDDIREDGLHAHRRKTRSRPKVYPWDDDGILERALEQVSEAHKGRVGSRYLFHTHDGRPYYELDERGHRAKAPSAFRSAWARAMRQHVKAGGTRFTEHDLRAKVASDAEAAHAQQLMDHTSAKTTEQVYRRAPRRVPIGGKKA